LFLQTCLETGGCVEMRDMRACLYALEIRDAVVCVPGGPQEQAPSAAIDKLHESVHYANTT
jgi:hypothetical protein